MTRGGLDCLLKRPVGISLKSSHYASILESRPAVSFFEIHAENYMMPAGPHHRYLGEISDLYALSMHGVGMSLGSAEGLDPAHLKRFGTLVERYDPDLVSEHLAWSVADGHYLNDLLPLPLNADTLKTVAANVDRMQQVIGRPILVENPSSYMGFADSTMAEPEFLGELASRTGCGLLLDANNIVVSCHNMGWSALDYIADFALDRVGEIHLAGHLVRDLGEDRSIRIDDHGSAVDAETWSLYEEIITRTGPVPTLIEWDNAVPELDVLLREAETARRIMDSDQERPQRSGKRQHA